MTENKRFIYFFDDFNDIRRYKEGTDNDFAEVITILDLIEDANKLSEENKELKKLIIDKNKTQTETLKQLTKTQKELITIKNTIKEMYNTERTHIGHNVLAQLMEAIQ